jgi:hypothetical protein
MSDLPPRDEVEALPVRDAGQGPSGGPAPSPSGDTLVGRLRDLIVAPGRLMDHVGARPRWWVPGLIVLVVMAGFTWLTVPISGPEQMEVMRDSKLMSMVPEEQWQAQYDAALNVTAGKRAITSLQAGVTGWLSIIVFGFVLGFFVRMSGGKGSFRQALGVTSWAALIPFALGSIVKAPLVLATESAFRVNLGLAALMPGGEPGSPLFQVLMFYGDFLTWWGLAVLVIGFSRVFGLSRNAAITSVVLPWALLSLIPLGLALIFM